jgi:hypothetical protein
VVRHGHSRETTSIWETPIVRTRADDIDDIKKFIATMDLRSGANVTDLKSKFDTKEYLSPHSDIVALMILWTPNACAQHDHIRRVRNPRRGRATSFRQDERDREGCR